MDAARKILQYKEDDDTLIRDKKGRRLSKKFFESIEIHNRGLISEAMNKIRDEMEGKTNEELEPLMAKMDEFLDMKTLDLVKDVQTREDFVRELCNLIV